MRSTTAPKVSLEESLFFQANRLCGSGCADETAAGRRVSYPSGWQGASALAVEKKHNLPSARWHPGEAQRDGLCPRDGALGAVQPWKGSLVLWGCLGWVGTAGAGWMCPQAWQGGTAGTTDPRAYPWLHHHLPAAAKSGEVGYGHTRPGEMGVRSWNSAGFQQPFGSRPNFQPEGVTQRVGFPPRLAGSLPSRQCLLGTALRQALAALTSPPAWGWHLPGTAAPTAAPTRRAGAEPAPRGGQCPPQEQGQHRATHLLPIRALHGLLNEQGALCLAGMRGFCGFDSSRPHQEHRWSPDTAAAGR
ncbi:uncharacterized protein LOC128853953 isoform X2 [Cuculus canorus]|uniref:uncharacterized protein LOC128853953 isoform X2 n=1 Tax=Cuculus canorus TaxID=55661 RepID=UPI0023AA45B5|nr:uncharacterized protein LOC128853953 isoform X2 [Cuculus canorus]